MRQRVLEAGTSAYVTKPFQSATLRDPVLGVLEQRRMGAARDG